MISSMLESLGEVFKPQNIGTLIRDRPLTAGLVAGAFGASVGAAVDHNDPGHGAVVGGALGVGALGAMKARALWKAAGPIGRTGILGLATVGLGVGAAYMTHHGEIDTVQDTAVPNGSGSYNVVATSGIKDRLAVINASGGITLGLHNSR